MNPFLNRIRSELHGFGHFVGHYRSVAGCHLLGTGGFTLGVRQTLGEFHFVLGLSGLCLPRFTLCAFGIGKAAIDGLGQLRRLILAQNIEHRR